MSRPDFREGLRGRTVTIQTDLRSSKLSRRALILFMRYPEAGKVKSRLAASLGHSEAVRIYERLVRRTLGVAADFKRSTKQADIFIALTPSEKLPAARRRYPGPWTFFPQTGSHLGERMKRAIEHVVSIGCGRVVLAGTDIADIQEGDFTQAFRALDAGLAALGPALDGGFYLIGLDRPCPSAFDAPQWGTGDIFRRTEEALRASGFQVKTLTRRRDVDRPEDIFHLSRDPMLSASLSVVIPTLGAPADLESLLQSLDDQLWPADEAVLVVAGNAPLEAVECPGRRIRILTAPKGRGLQLNRGAQAATGDVFLFLHGDSFPPPNFAYSVRKIVIAPQASLGCFHLSFSPSTPALRIIAGWANFRTRRLKLPYGDQGLFCTRAVYESAGGFRKQFLMEDVDFVRQCRRRGKLLILPDPIATSPRRYVEKGILRASLKNHLLLLLYHLGVEERRLCSLYYGR